MGVWTPQMKPSRRRGKAGRAPAKLDPGTLPSLRITPSRQFTNDWGEVSLWIHPRSVSIVLVNDEEPR